MFSEEQQKDLVVKGDRVWNGGLLWNFFTVLEKNWFLDPSVTADNSSGCSDLWESEAKMPCDLLVSFLAMLTLWLKY